MQKEKTAGFVLSLMVLGLLVFASLLAVGEILMGATILGNVIALALVALVSGLAFLISIPNVITARSPTSVGLMIASGAFGIYAVLRFVLDTVPAGYGP